MHDDSQKMGFVIVPSVREWGALVYNGRPLLPMFLSLLESLGISPWFGKSDTILINTYYVESTWWCRFCVQRASQYLCQIILHRNWYMPIYNPHKHSRSKTTQNWLIFSHIVLVIIMHLHSIWPFKLICRIMNK